MAMMPRWKCQREDDLGDGFAVAGGDLAQDGVGEEAVAALGEGGPGFHEDAGGVRRLASSSVCWKKG